MSVVVYIPLMIVSSVVFMIVTYHVLQLINGTTDGARDGSLGTRLYDQQFGLGRRAYQAAYTRATRRRVRAAVRRTRHTV